MADLTEIQSAQTVKVAGSNSSGTESNYLEVDSNGSALTTIKDPSGNGITSTLVSGKQALDVNIASASITANTGVVDKTTFTYGTDIEQTMGGVYQDTSPSVSAGQTAALRITQNRALHINFRNDSGTEIGTNSNPVRIDPTGTTTQPISASSLPLPTGAATAALQTQPGVDIGDVTINNASGASAVNIQDGGNSITVDGSVTVSSTDLDIRNLSHSQDNIKLGDGTDFSAITTNNDLKVVDGLRNGGVYGNLSLTTANTAYEAKVGGSRLTNRKLLTIVALDNMYWGYDSSVTSSNGTPLYKDQVLTFSIDADSTFQVWLVASSPSKNARVTESP